MKPYVAHFCRNTACNNAWLDVDDYNATTYPPKNKFCPDCRALGLKAEKDPVKVERGRVLAEQRKQALEAMAK